MKEPFVRQVWLDTIAAVHADSTTVNGIWNFNTAMSTTAAMEPICRYLDIYPGSVVSNVAVAAVRQSRTLTVNTATAGATYSVRISQYNRNTKLTYVKEYFYVATSVDTTTTIAQVFRTYFNNDPNFELTGATGGANIITVQAAVGYELFTMTVVNGTTLMASASTVTGIYSVGANADLVRMYVPTGFTGLTYTTWKFTFKKPANQSNEIAIAQDYRLNIYLQETDAAGVANANYAALQSYMLEQFAGLAAGGAGADLEIPAYI